MLPEEWPLEDGYSIELLAETNRAGGEEIVDFWVREGAMGAATARERVGEVLLVALGEGDEVVGVSSVHLAPAPRLGVQVWYQRGFVGAAHRSSNIGMQLAIVGIDHLERRFETGEDARGLGVVQQLENEGLKRYFNKGWEPPTDMVFIGESDRGDHVRVHWFPSARVPSRIPLTP